MGKEVDRFCGMLGEDERGSELVGHCCMVLGEEAVRNDVPWSDDVPIGQLYQDQTIDDLKRRMNELIDDVGLLPIFLIPGLLHHLTTFYEHISRPDAPSDAIDAQLDFIRFLESELKKPQLERRNKSTDEQLHRIIAKTKRNMTGGSERRESAAATHAWLQEQWVRHFPTEYWLSLTPDSL